MVFSMGWREVECDAAVGLPADQDWGLFHAPVEFREGSHSRKWELGTHDARNLAGIKASIVFTLKKLLISGRYLQLLDTPFLHLSTLLGLPKWH